MMVYYEEALKVLFKSENAATPTGLTRTNQANTPLIQIILLLRVFTEL